MIHKLDKTSATVYTPPGWRAVSMDKLCDKVKLRSQPV